MEDKSIYVNLNLLARPGQEPALDGYMVVEGDRIVATGTGEPGAEHADAERVDLGGKWVMPGLVDAHVHMHFPIRGRHDLPVGEVEYPEYTALRTAYNAQIYLATGVTSVMDQGTRGNLAVALRQAVQNGLCVGPRIVASGMIISPTAGLADEHPPFLHSTSPYGLIADTADDWTRIIRSQAKDGVDNIKIAASGSRLNRFSDTSAEDLNMEEISHIVEVSRRCGLSVSSHCNSPVAIRNSIVGGVDTVHHGFDMDDSVIEVLAENPSVYFVPTSRKLSAMVDTGPAHGRDPATLAGYASVRDRFHAALGRAVSEGLADRIALGSDQGHLPPHGHSADELVTFLEIGMTPAQALASATMVAAEAIGLGHLIGSLEPGKQADFLVLDSNPLDDPRILADRTNLTAVYSGGRLVAERGAVIDRPDLTAHLVATAVAGRTTRLSRRLRGCENPGVG